MHEILKQIRTDLRRSMNGIASKSMREKGLNYKLNFGVDIPRLRKLADNYTPSGQLADELWNSDVRELKILATQLHPIEEFDVEKAEKWVKEIPTHEIREQACINLFQNLDFADKLAQNWANASNEETRTTGYWLLARLLIMKSDKLNNINTRELLDKIIPDLSSNSYFLRLSAQNALKFLGRGSEELAQRILSQIQDFENSENAAKQEIYDSLSFEFDHFLSR